MGVLATEAHFYVVRMTPGAGCLPFSYASETRPAESLPDSSSHRTDGTFRTTSCPKLHSFLFSFIMPRKNVPKSGIISPIGGTEKYRSFPPGFPCWLLLSNRIQKQNLSLRKWLFGVQSSISQGSISLGALRHLDPVSNSWVLEHARGFIAIANPGHG